jgi:biopolymer transport protein ExbD
MVHYRAHNASEGVKRHTRWPAIATFSLAVAISLPIAASATELELHVNKNGSYTLDHKVVSHEQLRAALSRLTSTKGLEILVTGERGITFQQVDYAVKTAQEVGVKVRLSDRPIKK